MKAQLGAAIARLGLLKAGGPYIGPKGGKWSDPQHKHAYGKRVPDKVLREAHDAGAFEIEGYMKAGSAEAGDYGVQRGNEHGAPEVECVRCGSKIGHVFMTSHGPMGGDCVATITGDPSTRSLARKIKESLIGEENLQSLSVEAHGDGPGVWAHYQNGRKRCVYASRSNDPVTVAAIVTAMGEERGLPVTVDKTNFGEALRLQKERRAIVASMERKRVDVRAEQGRRRDWWASASKLIGKRIPPDISGLGVTEDEWTKLSSSNPGWTLERKKLPDGSERLTARLPSGSVADKDG